MIYLDKPTIIDKLMYRIRNRLGLPCNHIWQTRATNRFMHTTYRVCYLCDTSQQWVGGMNGRYVDCDHLPEFDEDYK